MYIIHSEIGKVYEEFPKIRKWINVIEKKILKREATNINVYYSYGFFVLKKQEIAPEETYKLTYEKRLKLELSKVRVDITIKSGNFIMTNRMNKIPQDIINIVTELTKVKMMIEGDFHHNQHVIDTIPEVNTDIIQYKIISEDDIEFNNEFNLDEILDKISINGIESLTKKEREFLEKSSKDLNGDS